MTAFHGKVYSQDASMYTADGGLTLTSSGGALHIATMKQAVIKSEEAKQLIDSGAIWKEERFESPLEIDGSVLQEALWFFTAIGLVTLFIVVILLVAFFI